jgi:hypothetical protein
MTEAERIISNLEKRRHAIMIQGVALDADRARIAYDAMVRDSFIARQRWRELNEFTDKLIEEIELLDCALVEARRRAAVPDWRDQFQSILGVTA